MRWWADTESTSRHKTTSHNGEMLIDWLDWAQPPAFCFLFNVLTSGGSSWGSRGVHCPCPCRHQCSPFPSSGSRNFPLTWCFYDLNARCIDETGRYEMCRLQLMVCDLHISQEHRRCQGVRERARMPQLVILCRRWANLQCFAGRTRHTLGTTTGYCVAGKRAQYRKI